MEFAGGIHGSSCVVPNRNARSDGCGGLQRSERTQVAVQGGVGGNRLIDHALLRSELKSPHAVVTVTA